MIPPHELKNKEFTRVMRGYSIPEVDEYIAFVMEKYTELYRENDALERKLQSALDNLEAMKDEEQAIRTALINAQKAGKKIVADASDRADKIMRSTKSDCMRVLAEFRDKTAAERKTLAELKTSVAVLKQELFVKYQEHIELIEKLTPNAAEEAAAITAIDSDKYAQKLSEGIEQLIREDYGVDITDLDAGAQPIHEEESDTLIFGKIEADIPEVQHVSFTEEAPVGVPEKASFDASEASSSAATRVIPAVKGKRGKKPSEKETAVPYDEELEALAADLEDSLFADEKQSEADTGIFEKVKK